jgi:hypothetical protein
VKIIFAEVVAAMPKSREVVFIVPKGTEKNFVSIEDSAVIVVAGQKIG